MRKIAYINAAILCGTILLSCRGLADTPDLVRIRIALSAELQAPPSQNLLNKAQSCLSTIREDGSWADISYESAEHKAVFAAREHLSRLALIANLARSTNRSDIRTQAIKVFSSGARYWIAARPQSPNGWFNTIDSPSLLGEAILLICDQIDQETTDLVVNYIKSFAKWPDLYYSGLPATGQNLLWLAKEQMVAALLSNDTNYYLWAENHFCRALSVSEAEGIQPDYSFHQHGPQLYSGGYGRALLTEAAPVLAATAPYSESARKCAQNVVAYILEGQRWFVYRNWWDFNAVGREIVRDSLKDTSILSAARRLARLKLDRAPELASLVAEYEKSGSYPAVIGSRYFWRSDTIVFGSSEWHASVRMASTRTLGNESGNGEGLLSYHLGNGSTCLMKTGTEYSGVFPLWDWTLVPGVTCQHQPEEKLKPILWGDGAAGGDAFVGGLATGDHGVAVMKQFREGISSLKGWFYMDKTLVCLGAGISCVQGAGVVSTSVDQCWAAKTVLLNNQPLSLGTVREIQTTDSLTVINGELRYRFPSGGIVHVEKQSRQASWGRIRAYTATDKVAKGEVFSLWLEHGRAPKDSSYAYCISSVTSEIQHEPVIIENSAKRQIVANNQNTIALIVFWTPGEAIIPHLARVRTDTPIVLEIERTSKGLSVRAVNPLQDDRTITVQVAGLDPNSNVEQPSQVIPLSFEKGPSAGQPLTATVP